MTSVSSSNDTVERVLGEIRQQCGYVGSSGVSVGDLFSSLHAAGLVLGSGHMRSPVAQVTGWLVGRIVAPTGATATGADSSRNSSAAAQSGVPVTVTVIDPSGARGQVVNLVVSRDDRGDVKMPAPLTDGGEGTSMERWRVFIEGLSAQLDTPPTASLPELLAAKLDEMQLHDATGDPTDAGYTACLNELREWVAAGCPAPQH